MHGSAARGIAIPFAPSPLPPLLHPPTSLALRLSLRSSLTRTPCPLGHHVGGIGIRSLSFPPFPLSSSLLSHAPTRVHVDRGHTANRKLNSRQRARRACFQLRGARETKLNDRDVFRLLRRRSYGGYERIK